MHLLPAKERQTIDNGPTAPAGPKLQEPLWRRRSGGPDRRIRASTRSCDLRRGGLDREQPVEREPSSADTDQRKEEACPAQVGRPGVRVDEDLDHRRHSEKSEGGGTREKPEHQENWK